MIRAYNRAILLLSPCVAAVRQLRDYRQTLLGRRRLDVSLAREVVDYCQPFCGLVGYAPVGVEPVEDCPVLELRPKRLEHLPGVSVVELDARVLGESINGLEVVAVGELDAMDLFE